LKIRKLKSSNESDQRLLGIDLFRGIAAYAIIFVHSGDEHLGLPISQAAISLRLFFYFAVPFFLATSFYFLLSKPEIDTPLKLWKSRLKRIIIPYATWTIAYLIFRLFFFFKSGQIERFWNLLHDPLGIFFMGNASYQLYFLPLLLTGNFLVLIPKYVKKIHTNYTITGFLAFFSIVSYHWLVISGNAFRLNPNLAFYGLSQTIGWDFNSLPPLRLLLVEISWILNCLPYLFIGILIAPLCAQINQWKSLDRLEMAYFCVALVIISSAILTFTNISGILKDVLQAHCLLVLSISLSNYIKHSWIIESIGACSFGIYLIHPFLMLGVKGMMPKILPALSNEVSVLSIFVISIGTFVSSWMVIVLMMKNKWISKYMLGT
jgi:peptidoglycan/LPS O-acetylase OafA/YrhL